MMHRPTIERCAEIAEEMARTYRETEAPPERKALNSECNLAALLIAGAIRALPSSSSPEGMVLVPEKALAALTSDLQAALDVSRTEVARSIYTSVLARLDRLAASPATPVPNGGEWQDIAGGVWRLVESDPPCPNVGDQEEVDFCSPDWSWPIAGLVTRFDTGLEWATYDQVNDKYVDWGQPHPTHWMLRPKVPSQEKPHGCEEGR